jgi:hypothetical protein
MEARARGGIVYIFAGWLLWQSTGRALAILPVKKVANRLPPGDVGFAVSLECIAVPAALGDGVNIGSAALRTVVGETGLTWLQLKLFGADGADFNRESHFNSVINDKGNATSWRAPKLNKGRMVSDKGRNKAAFWP